MVVATSSDGPLYVTEMSRENDNPYVALIDSTGNSSGLQKKYADCGLLPPFCSLKVSCFSIMTIVPVLPKPLFAEYISW